MPFLALAAAGARAADAPSAPSAPPFSVPRVLTVDKIEGTVRIKRGTTTVTAKPGTLVHESESLQLESRSKARLSIGDQTVIDLGPSTRLRVLQLGREDGGGMANLRLDYGYLRMVWADPDGKRDRPAAISFGSWAAMVSSGEFFFDVQKGRARACGVAGDLVFASTGGNTPKRLNGACTDLPAGKQPLTTPAPLEWQAMRDQFTLRPDLSRAVPKEAPNPLPAPVVAATTTDQSDRPAFLVVEAVTGTASAVRDSGRSKLAIGHRVEQGQRVETGDASGLRLSMKDEDTPFELGPTFELGPNTRATVRKLPVAGAGAALSLRLDDGAMAVLREPGENAAIPLEVSFAKWAARLRLGEFFLESRDDSATACQLPGDMTLTGVPAASPKAARLTCTGLKADEAPRDVPLPEIAALRDIVAVQRVLRSQLPVPYIVGPTSNAAGGAPAAAPRAIEATLRPASDAAR
ncbi:MAG TPA: hypothetical protein VJM11_12460 [Nevskiaceae bacterium]|nr:hypothetical protein [Nevskiaceae bacterium]